MAYSPQARAAAQAAKWASVERHMQTAAAYMATQVRSEATAREVAQACDISDNRAWQILGIMEARGVVERPRRGIYCLVNTQQPLA
jgi:sugar-specific transcriptional regulator TrmB